MTVLLLQYSKLGDHMFVIPAESGNLTAFVIRANEEIQLSLKSRPVPFSGFYNAPSLSSA